MGLWIHISFHINQHKKIGHHFFQICRFVVDMEKMKVDSYSPTCVLEDYLRSLESDTVSSKESTSGSEDHHQKDAKPSKWVDFVHLIKSKSRKYLPTFHPVTSGLQLSRRLSSSFREHVTMVPPSPMVDMSYFKPHWKNFTFSQLQYATNNFSNGKLLIHLNFQDFLFLSQWFRGCLSMHIFSVLGVFNCILLGWNLIMCFGLGGL